MKKTTRLAFIAVLALVVVACGSVLVACGGNAKEAIEAYILDINTVEDDFILPKYIGELNKEGVGTVKVSWKSDNDAITIEERENDFLAKVTQGTSLTNVKLTISAKGNEKEFTVKVLAFDVYSLSGSYVFVNNRAVVGADFELDKSWTYKGHKAEISWAAGEDENSAKHIEIVEQGDKLICKVTLPEGDPVGVAINATFSYNNETTTVPYTMTIGETKEHMDYVDTIYSVQNYSLKLSGYVVAIHEIGTSYGNATFYMIDDDFCSGYYLYRVKMSAGDLAKMAIGVHVTITGDKTKNYNGLWENSGGGTAVIDDAPEGIPATIKPEEHVYAIDNDFIAGSPATIYRESTLVSLTNWEIVEKYNKAPTAGATSTMFYLKKGDSEKIAVTLSKYMEGHYKTAAGDAKWEALCAYYDSLNVGDVISITGILGYYNGFQIQPLEASAITKTSADAAGTTYLGTAVKSALKAVNDALDEAKIDGTIVAHKEFTLPTSSNGVTISYEICGESKAVKIEGGKVTVDPASKEARKIQVTYTNGAYKTYSFFTLNMQALTNAEIVANVKKDIDSDLKVEFKAPEEVTLPTETAYPGVTVTWSLKEAVSWATIDNNKLKITAATQDSTAILVVTIECNGVSDYKEITISYSIAKEKVVTLNPESLGLTDTYSDGSAVVGGWTINYKQLYYKDAGIQVRVKDGQNSSIYAEFDKKIEKIELNIAANKSAYDNTGALKFEFGTDDNYGLTQMLDTKAGVMSYTVTPTADSTCLRITHMLSFTGYWDSIIIYLAD